jgi:endonuclease YncB( thermonuclease family)
MVPSMILRWLPLSILLFCASALPAQLEPLSRPFYGIALAKDGNSLTVDAREVRLFGIDAPEFNQTCKRSGANWACGTEAADRLSRLVTGREVRCKMVNTDEYGRAVSRCTVGTTDINAAMVESGYALAYRHYSSDYVTAEQRAKSAKRGLWSGTFETPRAHRLEERRVTATRVVPRAKPAARPAGRSSDWANRSNCTIKGNQNRRGQFIYHIPGMPYYDQTRPEQIFCTEAEARVAGYRRAIVKR